MKKREPVSVYFSVPVEVFDAIRVLKGKRAMHDYMRAIVVAHVKGTRMEPKKKKSSYDDDLNFSCVGWRGEVGVSVGTAYFVVSKRKASMMAKQLLSALEKSRR